MTIRDSSDHNEESSGHENELKGKRDFFDPHQPTRRMLKSQDTVDKRIINIYRLHRAKEIL